MSDYRKIAAEVERLVLPEWKVEPEEVERSQRRRLHLALALEAHRRGYEVASVDEIAEAARLSKTTLYALFEGKDDLLAAAVGDFRHGAEAAIDSSTAAEADWAGAIGAGVDALVDSIVAEPALARLTFVEGPVILTDGSARAPRAKSGGRGRRRFADTVDLALVGRVIEAADGVFGSPSEPLDDLTRLATLGGMAAPISDRLMRGRSAEIRDLAPSLTFFAINAHLGPEPALAAVK